MGARRGSTVLTRTGWVRPHHSGDRQAARHRRKCRPVFCAVRVREDGDAGFPDPDVPASQFSLKPDAEVWPTAQLATDAPRFRVQAQPNRPAAPPTAGAFLCPLHQAGSVTCRHPRGRSKRDTGPWKGLGFRLPRCPRAARSGARAGLLSLAAPPLLPAAPASCPPASRSRAGPPACRWPQMHEGARPRSDLPS